MNPLKPRFNRSKISVIPRKKHHEVFVHGTLRDKNTVQWSQMSKETFEEMVERGVLSEQQILEWELKNGKSDKNLRLINKISKLDLGTIEGLKEFKKILEKDPEAINCVCDATKIRNSR